MDCDSDEPLTRVNKMITVVITVAVLLGLSGVLCFENLNNDTVTTVIAVCLILLAVLVFWLISKRIDIVSPENCRSIDKMSLALLLVEIAIGVVTAFYYDTGQNNMMFIPLAIGFAVMLVLFYLIQKRADIKNASRSDKE